MTLCKSASRERSCPTASRTGPRRSASAGSAAASTPGTSTTAIPSARAPRRNAAPNLSSSCRPRLELALQVLREFGDGRMIEQLGQIDEPWEFAIDVLVNLDQLERACADVE